MAEGFGLFLRVHSRRSVGRTMLSWSSRRSARRENFASCPPLVQAKIALPIRSAILPPSHPIPPTHPPARPASHSMHATRSCAKSLCSAFRVLSAWFVLRPSAGLYCWRSTSTSSSMATPTSSASAPCRQPRWFSSQLLSQPVPQSLLSVHSNHFSRTIIVGLWPSPQPLHIVSCIKDSLRSQRSTPVRAPWDVAHRTQRARIMCCVRVRVFARAALVSASASEKIATRDWRVYIVIQLYMCHLHRYSFGRCCRRQTAGGLRRTI